MATKYWVPSAGVASGNTSDTNHWSLTPGGAGGAGAPSASESAIFDNNSDVGAGFTVTVDAAFTCLDFDNTAVDQIMTLAGSQTMAISGSLALKSNTVRTYTGVMTFNATSTGKTITTNGVSLASNINLNGVGGGWALGSAFTTTGSFTVTAGAFDTANYALASVGFISSGSGVRSITLGSSAITQSGGWNLSTPTNLTFNAGTSLITIIGNSSFDGGGLTYYDVTYAVVGAFIANPTISGANTFRNLTNVGPTDSSTAGTFGKLTLSGDQIVTGTFTSNQSTHINARVAVTSNIPSVRRTITAAVVSMPNTDFQSIGGAGAGTWTGTNTGDGGNNSGISGFATPKTVYAVGTTSWNWDANVWATTSGGSPSIANFPLPQDTVIFDNSSANTSAAVSVNRSYLLPGMDFSARSNAITINPVTTGDLGIVGPLTLNSAVTFSALTISFSANRNFNQNGATISGAVRIINPGTTLTLTGNLTTSNTITYNYGNLSHGSYTLTGTTMTANTTETRTWDFGTGKVSLTGNNASIFVWNCNGLTVSGTPLVESTYSGATGTRTVSSTGITEATSISFNFTAGTDTVSISSCRSLNLTGFAGTLANGGRTLYGDLTIPAGVTITAGANSTTFGKTSGTQTVITNGVTLDFPLVHNGAGGTVTLGGALTIGATRLFTQTNGTWNLAGYTMTVGTFVTTAGTKNRTYNGGTLVVVGSGSTAYNNNAPTNYSETAGAGGVGVISLTSASAKTFVGSTTTYAARLRQGGAGALTLTGAFTADNIDNTGFGDVLFTAGTTFTFANGFSLSGNAGNQLQIKSPTASAHTLSLGSGTVNVVYCTITNSHATGGASWLSPTGAAGNVDGGGNTGWNFSTVYLQTVSASNTPAPGVTTPSISLTKSASNAPVPSVGSSVSIAVLARNPAVAAVSRIAAIAVAARNSAQGAISTAGALTFNASNTPAPSASELLSIPQTVSASNAPAPSVGRIASVSIAASNTPHPATVKAVSIAVAAINIPRPAVSFAVSIAVAARNVAHGAAARIAAIMVRATNQPAPSASVAPEITVAARNAPRPNASKDVAILVAATNTPAPHVTMTQRATITAENRPTPEATETPIVRVTARNTPVPSILAYLRRRLRAIVMMWGGRG